MADATRPGVIECEKFIAHPPAAVWKALTDPELHARWWAAGDVRPVVGHRFELDMGQWGPQKCEVTAVEPERLLSYSFGGFTTVTWRLRPEGKGTRLFLEHAGFDLEHPYGKQAYEGLSDGWPQVLDRIEPTLTDA